MKLEVEIEKLQVQNKSSFSSIDLLRFFAAFSVYCYHQRIGVLIGKFLHIKLFEYTDAVGASFAVPLFFLLSGFCIHLSNVRSLQKKSDLNLKKYYSKRFWRIYPPYLFALLFAICVTVILQPDERFSLMDLFLHTIVFQGFSTNSFNSINIVFWTITVELAFYFVYPLYYYIQLKYSSKFALLFSATVSAMSIAFFQCQPNSLSLPQRYFFTNIWFAWCFGAWLCDQYVNNPTFFISKKWKSFTFIIIVLFFSTFSLVWKNDILVKYNVYILVWSPLLMIFLNLESKFKQHKQLFKLPIALGVSSYSLYLLHQPLIVLKNHLIHVYVASTYQVMFLLIAIPAIPFICYLNYIFVEKPFISFGKNSKQF